MRWASRSDGNQKRIDNWREDLLGNELMTNFAENVTIPLARIATSPGVQGGDSADGVAVLWFQCGVCCCLMYWMTMEIGAPLQLAAK